MAPRPRPSSSKRTASVSTGWSVRLKLMRMPPTRATERSPTIFGMKAGVSPRLPTSFSSIENTPRVA